MLSWNDRKGMSPNLWVVFRKSCSRAFPTEWSPLSAKENLQLCNSDVGAKSLEKSIVRCCFHEICAGVFSSGYFHQNIWVHSASSFLRVGVANVGSCERKEIVWFWKHVAMLALLARCHVPILSHEAAWNMMMFYLCQSKMMSLVRIFDAWGYLWKYRNLQILKAFQHVNGWCMLSMYQGKTHSETTGVWNPNL